MWLYLVNVIFLINLTTCEYNFPSKMQKISKPFDLKAFSGTWFEAGVYNTLLIPPKLTHWPNTLSYCPTWHFSVKPGENPTVMDVTYYTTGVKKAHPMIFTGTVQLKSSSNIKEDKAMYEMHLRPTESESMISSGKIHVEFAVIDTDYDNYAFIYLIQHYVMLEARESVVALSRYKNYAKNFKREWMTHTMGQYMDYYYNLSKCKQALPEDKPPT